jgi:SNF2 family DNA or RNA helicase
MEMGTGKTLATIAVLGRRYLNGQIKKALVICPNSVIPVWPKEFALHADFPHQILPLEGSVKKRAERLLSWEPDGSLQVAVINYEGARNMEQELAQWQPEALIFDEAHRLKTPGTQQSKMGARLAKLSSTKYRMVLTGTPVTQGPLDFYGIYRALDPSIFGKSYYAFKSRYAIMGGYEGKQVVGYQNLDELVQKAHSIAFRITKAEALDLPPVVEQELYCELEPKAERL